MSWWNAKYKNNHGEYEITFASKSYEKAKAVEKICQAVIDMRVKDREDVEAVVRCKDCKYVRDFSGCIRCDHPDLEWDVECYDLWLNRNPDDFCSQGERIDDV